MVSKSDLQGVVAIVTGATSGIGFETAAALCGRGAEVVFGVRNLRKAKEYAEQIRQRYPEAKVVIPEVPLDFENQSSIRQFASWYLSTNKPINILVNNAGTSFMPLKYTTDDVTILVQTNYLGPYTLTRLLEQRLVESRARIVNLASITHRMANITDPESFMRKPEQGHYEHTKLAMVLFAYETQRRLGDYGVTACAADPGGVRTSIWSHSSLLSKPPFSWAITTLYAPPEDGAIAIVDAATMDWKVHLRHGVPPSKDLRYYAKGFFAAPLAVGMDGWFDGLMNPVRNAIAAVWRGSAVLHTLVDYPLRKWSQGAVASETVPVPSSGPSYNRKLAADLWDLSALIAGVPAQPSEKLGGWPAGLNTTAQQQQNVGSSTGGPKPKP